MSQDDFPNRVRIERKRQGLTQQELADRAGVSLRMIQTFEGRKSAATPTNRAAIAGALGLDENGDGGDRAAETREGWPSPVRIFLDMLGAYLMTFPENRREDVMHDLTRQIFESHR